MDSGWIPVEERLPEENVYVLIVTKAQNGSRNIDKGYMLDERWVKRGYAAVTHWMPMPELPEGGK